MSVTLDKIFEKNTIQGVFVSTLCHTARRISWVRHPHLPPSNYLDATRHIRAEIAVMRCLDVALTEVL